MCILCQREVPAREWDKHRRICALRNKVVEIIKIVTDDQKIMGKLLDSMDLMVLYPYGNSEIGAHSEIGNLICLRQVTCSRIFDFFLFKKTFFLGYI